MGCFFICTIGFLQVLPRLAVVDLKIPDGLAFKVPLVVRLDETISFKIMETETKTTKRNIDYLIFLNVLHKNLIINIFRIMFSPYLPASWAQWTTLSHPWMPTSGNFDIEL